MLKFEKYSVETLLKYKPYIDKSPLRVNDVSVGSFFMWNKGVNLAFCLTMSGAFISRQDVCGEPAFSYPFGGDENEAIEQLKAYCLENNLPLKFYGVSDETLEKMKENKVVGKLSYAYDVKWSDYVYSFREMRDFIGKKFGGQRNHIHKFLNTYPEAKFTPFTKDDLPKVREFLDKYKSEHGDGLLEENDEYRHTRELAEKFFDLGLIGGKYELNGEVISVTIGEIQGDTLIIHIEKALKSFAGAYPATFNAFVKYVESIYGELEYVNREDDSGDAGLRTSKQQYNPILMINKNIVKVDSPFIGVQIPVIKGEKVVLSEITESDKPEYLALCTDEENNKYWGYDYKEDESITSAIDENTFYDIVKFDRAVGDSINFAVRESENGKLVGETIIYNSTLDNHIEAGCRISAAHSGKGIGSEAFALTVKFAESIGCRVTAKCYKANEKSRKMLLACGMEFTREDETFYYFIHR